MTGKAAPPLTVLSWNVENLARYLGGAGPALPAIVARFGHPELVCLQEIRVRPADTELVRALEQALPGYTCAYALAHDPKNAAFRGGRTYGVATYIRDSLDGVTSTTLDDDREGRLVVTELPAPRLAVFNLYAVNGTAKPYYDHALGRFEGDRHAFKRRFQDTLLQQGQRLLERGLSLVLIGDWNVSRTQKDIFPRLRTAPPHTLARRHVNDTLIPALDLVDAFRELHPDARRYTWFNRLAPPGTLDAARVDYALISRRLLPHVRAAEICDDVADRFGSDHAPLLLRLQP